MDTSNKLDKNSLLIQLENYETFLQLQGQTLEGDRLLKEQVAHRMMMLRSAVIELEMWEIIDDQKDYEQSLGRANRIAQGVKILIEYMLHPGNPPDGCFQSVS